MPATDKTVRNSKTMHVVFLLSVVAFTASTCTMLYKDHDDEWRGYQRKFLSAEAIMLRGQESAALVAATGAGATDQAATDALVSYTEKKQKLEAARDEAAALLESGDQAYADGESLVSSLALEFDLKGRQVRSARAKRDVARADYDFRVRDEVPADEIASFLTTFEERQADVETLELAWEQKGTELTVAQTHLATLTEERDRLDSNLKLLTADVDRIHESLDQIAPESGLKSLKRPFMEWPIVDGFNSHMRLVQDWLPDLSITLGMTKTARFDRCRTCHLGIDRFGAGDVPTFPHGETDSDNPEDWVAANAFPQPFSGHPRPDVYLTAASPHPLPEFGCTICHDGQGSATSFTNAQHGPNDPDQDHEWYEKYNHSHNHFWEYPMLPERLRDAACIKCHHDVIELGVNPEFGATAPEAYRGWQLIRKYGCFGCHEINGYDGQDRIGPDLRLEPTAEEADRYASDPNLIPGQMRKVGPSLKRIADKTTADWIAYWTEKPKRFRATTKMPQFFGLTNLQDHLGEQLSSLELRALGAFLIKQSSTEPANGQGLMSPPEGYKPDAERGVKMFSEKGCLACHSHDGEEFKGATATFGPNLTNVGRKLRAGESGFNWLYTWIRDPERHHPRTKMPNLFLEPVRNKAGELISDPAADIAAFLIGPGGYDLTPLDADEARTELAARLVQTGKLSQTQFDEFLKSHDYTQPASWPETLLTTTEAGELNWADVVSGYIDATDYPALLSEHLVAGGLLTAEEFDGFLSSRTYPESSAVPGSAPVVWPETLLQQDTDSDARWAAVQQEYLLAKATLELSRLYLSGKVLTSDQFATLWGINWQGERKYTQLIARLREEEEQAGSEGKDQEAELKLKLQIKDAQANLDAIQNGRGKLPLTRDQVKGDEIELYTDGDAVPTEEQFREKMLNFLGRRSVARYGCYGCHDINGFGSARSIGTALQDWGRKDPSRLAPEHIHEYLHHHGRRDGSSQQQYVEKSLARATDDSFDTEAERDSALRTAFFYDSLIHHGRPGFIFQKLRQPRSYDYKKTDTKGYTERLVMPMFPLQDDEIEAISTFVLGLVAEPPAPKYIYSPDQRTKDRNHGEILLQKYNCGGCHVLEMPELEFAYTEESQFAASELSGTDLAAGRDALLRVRPPVQGYFGKFHSLKREDEPAESLPVVRLRGLVKAPDPNDPEYDPEDPDPYILTAWEPVRTRGALAAKNQARMDEVEALFDRTASSLAGADLTGKVTEVLTTLTEESSTDWLGALDRSSLRGVAAGTVGRLSLFFESAGDTGPLAVPQAELVQIAAVFEALADGQTGEIESLGTTAAELATGLADFLVPGPMGDTLLPSKPVFATGPELVNYQKARGGAFAEWLVKYQVDSKLAKDPNFAWQASPPPLFREGEKVQTDWLYRFLKNPTQIRYTTLLRMPRFNLSDSEAQALTNYFAAVDGSTYPYEKQPQQRASYLAAKQAQFQTEFPERAAVSNYDDESWRMLTSTLCIQCHAVGNDLPKGDPDKPGELIRGPNLNRVHERLRPDWVSVWLFNPAWVTSYTSMPAPFGAHVSGPKNPYLPLFNGDSLDQTNGVRDALMNYPAFLERGYKPLPLIAKPVPDTGTGQ